MLSESKISEFYCMADDFCKFSTDAPHHQREGRGLVVVPFGATSRFSSSDRPFRFRRNAVSLKRRCKIRHPQLVFVRWRGFFWFFFRGACCRDGIAGEGTEQLGGWARLRLAQMLHDGFHLTRRLRPLLLLGADRLLISYLIVLLLFR